MEERKTTPGTGRNKKKRRNSREPEVLLEGDLLVNTPKMVGLVWSSLALNAAYLLQVSGRNFDLDLSRGGGGDARAVSCAPAEARAPVFECGVVWCWVMDCSFSHLMCTCT